MLALDAEGEDIRELTVPEKFALLIGEEGRGLPEEARAPRPDTAPPAELHEVRKIGIPISDNVESLNAAAALAIALYALRR